MRRFLISLSFVLLALAAPKCAFSQSADTSDLFLNAYMANEAGEHLESSGDGQKALSKYRYAASLLDQISREDPKWQPIVIDYRKRKVSENIARLQQQAAAQAAAQAAQAPAPASAPIEGALPQRENPSAPDLTGATQPAPPTAGAGISQEVRDQLDQLQTELRESRQRLKAVESQKADLAGKLSDALKQLDRTKITAVELKGQLKQAQDAYQNSLTDHSQTAGSQKQLQTRVTQLESALKDAEADRDAANEQNAEATRRDKARVAEETDLKNQLKQAQDSLAAQTSQPGAAALTAQKALQTRVSQLEDALKNTEADREAADEESAQYARRTARAHEATETVAKELDTASAHTKEVESKLSDASKLAPQLDAANEKIAALAKSRDEATEHASDLGKQLASTSETTAKLAGAQKQIAALTKSRDEATEHASDLEKQLASTSEAAARLVDAQKQIAALKADKAEIAQKNSDISAKLADTQKQIDQLTADRDTALSQVTKLNGKLATAQKEIVAVKTDRDQIAAQRDQIAAQRDQALADLLKARQAQKHVDELIAQNASLMQKVAADEKTIHDFKSDAPQKDKQIADLRQEVSETKALLTASQQDRDNVQSTLNDLQQQYDTTSSELADLKANTVVSSNEKKSLTDENDLLRGIVLRELKQQAHRDQAKRQVMSELSQLQIQSDTLLQQIDLLGQPVVQLTDKEKALFKDPSIDLPDADDTTMAISIAAPKRTASTKVSAPIPAPAEDALPAKKSADASTPAPAAPESSPASAISAASPSASPMELASRTAPASPEAALSPAPSVPTSSPAAEKPASAASSGEAPHAESAASSGTATMVPTDLMDDAKAAKEAFERTEYRQAERIYERMLTKAPNNVYILSNLGVVYFRNQKFKLAEESLQKAIAVAPEDTFSHCTLGIVYYQEKRYDDAINSLTRALAINPKYAVAHNYLGITASQKGWQEAALKELETAIDLDPNYGDACFNLAVVYAMQQPPNKDMARKFYKRATDLGAEPDAGLEQLVK